MLQNAKSEGSYDTIDLWPMDEVVGAVVALQARALTSVERAGPALARAIEALAGRLRQGGRMAYAGAGSSGVLAQLDALEMPGTFGIPSDRVPVILAGGTASLLALDGAAEDDVAAGEAAVDALELGPRDGLIAITASGSTPFTLAALKRARARGAVTVGLACRSGAPLLAACDHPVLIETGAEVIAGSTRMAAGTAQKCALNLLSTGVAMRLGHAYRGLMVNMAADNAKLRDRAVAVVAKAAAVDPATAGAALQDTEGSIKAAIVVCAKGVDAATAHDEITRHRGDLRAVMAGDT